MSPKTIHRANIANPTAQQWEEQIERDLKGASFERRLVHRTAEGIEIQPLYAARQGAPPTDYSGFPGTHNRTRGETPSGQRGGWEILSIIHSPDSDTAVERAVEELSNGAHGLYFGASSAARSPSFWPQLFRKVDPRNTILSLPTLAPGEQQLAALLDASTGAGAREDELCIHAGLDPLGSLARDGWLEHDAWRRIADLLNSNWTASPSSRCLRIDDLPYHYAGASEAQSLGFVIAAAIDSMRALETTGVSPTVSASQLEVLLHLDCEFFLGIAKVRALRRLWSNVREHCGVQSTLRIHSRTSPRVLSERDPWVNILRNTTTCFAGAVAGVQAISTDSFDCRIGLPSDGGQRLARNTQLVLGMESHLDKVIDPAGGSYFIEELTQDLAEKAWAFTQEIEALGGMRTALTTGWVNQQIEGVRDHRQQRINKRKKPITGVSEFPHLAESISPRPAHSVQPARTQPDTLDLWQMQPLPRIHFADSFEGFRERSDRWLEQRGKRPEIALLQLGSPANHTGRSTFVRNLIQAGGFEASLSPPLLELEHAVTYVNNTTNIPLILCGSNSDLAKLARPFAQLLEKDKQRFLWVAGQPDPDMESYYDAGIQQMVKLGDDMVERLEALWNLVEGK